MDTNLNRRGLLGVAGIASVAALAKGAGPINPPAGPVAPSGRTLDEVYAAVITNGSDARVPAGYSAADASLVGIVNGNWFCTEGRSGPGTLLTIAGSNITLDLNGQTFLNSGTGASNTGIIISGTRSNITIRNGIFVGGNLGISITGPSQRITLERLTFIGQRAGAVNASSSGCRAITIQDCTVLDVGAGTTSADGTMGIDAILLGGALHAVRNTSIRGFDYNGSGTPTFRGINLLNSVAAGGIGHTVEQCTVVGTGIPTGGFHTGLQAVGQVAYRNNTVLGFPTTAYQVGSGSVNAGGNVSG